MYHVRQPSIGFLVRFWQEAEGEKLVWTGEVRHVTTGHSVQFRGLGQLFTILERVLAVAGEPSRLEDTCYEQLAEMAKREA
ncbi:MAG: hypothetical protein ACUVRC_05485 [Desulfotomaculales bacterium]